MNVLSELRRRFSHALAPLADDVQSLLGLIKPAQDERFGEYQANCAMPLGKRLNKPPRAIAEQIVAALDVADLCDPPQIAGPGFINLKLRDDWIEQQTTSLVHDERLGVETTAKPRSILIDYSAPNVAKPMHVGHLRSTVIGAALYRLFQFAGHRVQSDNHIGDWGTQFGMIIYGYKHLLDAEAYRRQPVQELGRLYRLVNRLSDYADAAKTLVHISEQLREIDTLLEGGAQAGPPTEAEKRIKKLNAARNAFCEELQRLESLRRSVDSDSQLSQLAARHPNIAEDARRETAKLHAGDPENKRLWSEFVPQCLAALDGVYQRLGISFDMTLGESFYQPFLADVVESLVARGIARESDGAMCVFIDENAAPFIVRKGDGAFTYATTDLATIRYRVEVLKSDTALYVVDDRQAEHFRLLFSTAERLGYHLDCRHISFGTILGEDKRPFKTRSGDTVGLESLLDEAVTRARRIVDENDDTKDVPELDERARQAVAEAVGIGGIKYADLRHNRESDYAFQWEKMLATTGDTATYIQYSNARICGIFRKGGIDRESVHRSAVAIHLSLPTERRLALQLLRFAEAVDAALEDCRPHFLTQFLFATADCFTRFYEECPVLKEPDAALRTSRLALCDLTSRVLEKGLFLLGIAAPEQM